VTHIQLHNGMS